MPVEGGITMQDQPDSQEIRADAMRTGVTETQGFPSGHHSTDKRLSHWKVTKNMTANGFISATRNLASRATRLFTGNTQSVPAWWGTDSSTQTCCAMPQNFYIGRLGYGAEPLGDSNFFNVNAAQSAGRGHTYGYWGLVGPDIRPTGVDPYVWGELQADNAWNACQHGSHAYLVGGLTVFADVETGFGGWTSGNNGPNQDVLTGFLDRLFAITPPAVWPGLYISPYFWTGFFGQSFRPTTDFVLWVTGCDTCGGDICNPCDYSCNTLTTVRNRLTSTVGNVTLGGRKTVLWQYWLSDCGCGDFDVLTQDTPSLLPVKGTTIYYSPC